jgi:predicted RNA-binding protein YlxR (DUF448 family)
MAGERRSPVRTCVACGRKSSQGELLRLALDQGRVEPDPRRRLPGRGAYICPRRECAQRLWRGRGKGRPFKVSLGEGAWLGFLEKPEIAALPVSGEEPRRT